MADEDSDTRVREQNRIQLPDGTATNEGARQVEAFSRAGQARQVTDLKDTGPSLLKRFGRLLGQRGREGSKLTERASSGESHDIPESLRRRYAVHVSDSGKTIQLFETGAQVPTIMLDARAISTPHDSGAVIVDVVMLARDRGWQSLKVAGTAEFRNAIWLEGQKTGLTVQHEPSPAVRAAFTKWDQERPQNGVQQYSSTNDHAAEQKAANDLGIVFVGKSPEERLADPRLRNAQLELMVGMRTAEKELGRPLTDMPEVLRALTAAVGQQLSSGKVFDAPFVKPEPPKRAVRRVTNPRIEADRIPPPRP